MGARFTSRLTSHIVPMKLNDIELAVLDMAIDVHRRAVFFAPVVTSALRNSGRIERTGRTSYRVWFGSSRVPYARIQELGGIIRPKKAKMLSWIGPDGQRVFAHSVTIKGTKYLTRAGDSVKHEGIGRYLGKR